MKRTITVNNLTFELEAIDWPTKAAAIMCLERIDEGLRELGDNSPTDLTVAFSTILVGKEQDPHIVRICSMAWEQAVGSDELSHHECALELRAITAGELHG